MGQNHVYSNNEIAEKSAFYFFSNSTFFKNPTDKLVSRLMGSEIN